MDIKVLRHNYADDEAWLRVAVGVNHIFEAGIPGTQAASGPPSPARRIEEWVLKCDTLPKHGSKVHIPGYEIDPRFFQ